MHTVSVRNKLQLISVHLREVQKQEISLQINIHSVFFYLELPKENVYDRVGDRPLKRKPRHWKGYRRSAYNVRKY